MPLNVESLSRNLIDCYLTMTHTNQVHECDEVQVKCGIHRVRPVTNSLYKSLIINILLKFVLEKLIDAVHSTTFWSHCKNIVRSLALQCMTTPLINSNIFRQFVWFLLQCTPKRVETPDPITIRIWITFFAFLYFFPVFSMFLFFAIEKNMIG